jgi:hypothetical protein
MLTVNGEDVPMHNRSQGVFVTDSLSLSGFNTIIATTPALRDSTTLTIGNFLLKK